MNTFWLHIQETRSLSLMLVVALLVVELFMPYQAFAEDPLVEPDTELQSTSEEDVDSSAGDHDGLNTDEVDPQGNTSLEESIDILEEGLPESEEGAATPSFGSVVSDGEGVSSRLEEELSTGTSTLTTLATTTLASTTLNATTSLTSIATSSTPTPDSLDQEEAGETSIVSGQAIALANILNIINTNFINSNGVILFSNFFDYISETLDLRNYSEAFGSALCDGTSCAAGEELQVNISNNASIENTLLLEASSGGNLIEGSENASIETGDAYAGLNLINLANNSFIDSNYLLLTLNAFNDVDGDIVFPSLENFFENLGSSGDINIEHTGSIENNIDVGAHSGDNTIEGAQGSTIVSGDSHGSSNVFNQLNTSLVGGSNVSILFRVHGDWVGEIFGTPDNVSWIEGDDGSLYLFDLSDPSGGGGSSSHTNGANSVLIENNIGVMALTGENHISGAETALITTGDAYAGANILNVANSTVVGQNWILAIINIFGDFRGDIAFGRPDLWVGEQISTPERVDNGSTLEYTFTIINNGDTRVHDVVLTDEFDATRLNILDSSNEYSLSTNTLRWNLGTLLPGEAREVTYRALVQNANAGDEITNRVSVEGRETDNNRDDNSDTATVLVYRPGPAPVGLLSSHNQSEEVGEVLGEEIVAVLGDLLITRHHSVSYISGENRDVEQSISIYNRGEGTSIAPLFRDVILDRNANEIHREEWDLGEIHPGEEVIVSYTISFDEGVKPGLYRASSELYAENVRNIESTGDGYIFVQPLADVVVPDLAQGDPVVAKMSDNIARGEDDRTLAEHIGDLILPEAEAQDFTREDNPGNSHLPFILAMAILLVSFEAVRRTFLRI